MALSIVTLGLGLAAVMTMLTLLAMLSADPLPGVSQHLYLGWVDSRELPRSGGKASDDSASPASLWNMADVQAMAAADRKSVVEGKSVSVRVALGGRRILK